MSKRASVTEADMKRAIRAASECGLTVSEVIMTADSVRLKIGKVDETPRPTDTNGPLDWPEG